MLFADRLADQMRACGLSQAALARKVGVSQQSIGRLVSGGAVGSRHLHKIAAALKTTPAYLTGETDDPTSEVPDDALSNDERELIESFRRLTRKDQAAMRQLIGSLSDRDPEPNGDHTPAPATLHTPGRTFRAGGREEGEAA